MIVAGSVTTKVNEQVVLFSVVGCVLLLFSAASTCCVLKKIVPFFMTKSRYPVFCFFDGLPCDVAGNGHSVVANRSGEDRIKALSAADIAPQLSCAAHRSLSIGCSAAEDQTSQQHKAHCNRLHESSHDSPYQWLTLKRESVGIAVEREHRLERVHSLFPSQRMMTPRCNALRHDPF